MPVTYTITSGDVASVDAASSLVAGVIFDWTNQVIKIPDTINSIGPQWIVDHARFAADTIKGMARGTIVKASGKIQKGTDPDTLTPILTAVTPTLQENWIVETLKTSGTFIITDIYNPSYTEINGIPPYVDVAGVDIRYRETSNAVIAQITTGSGLDSSQSAQLAALYATLSSSGVFSGESLVNSPGQFTSQALLMLQLLYRFRHLDPSNPITTDKTGDTTTETDGTVTITHVVNTNTETVVSTRTG